MMEGSDIIAAEAIIDNGRFGKRVVRLRNRPSRQAGRRLCPGLPG